MGIRFTVADNSDEKRVGKLAKIVDGRVECKADGKGHPDRFLVVEIDEPKVLCRVALGLKPHQLVVAGVPKCGAEEGDIVLKRDRKEGDIALSGDDFEWPDGPGLMLLDYDRKTVGEGWRPELEMDMAGFQAAVHKEAPGLLLPSGRWPSSSSCISGKGVEPRPLRGFHHAVFVADATDIPRAGLVLFKRLVLAGYGFAFVNKTGRADVRTIVDKAVWKPAQPMFIGGVAVGDGLVQDRGPHVGHGVSAEPVDTRLLMPDLTDDEQDLYEAECQRLIEAAAPLSATRRTEWVRVTAVPLARTLIRTKKLSPEAARAEAEATVAARLPKGTGADDWPHATLDGAALIETARGVVTVDEILAEPEMWDGEACADPLEPEYGSGVGTAKLHTKGTANIFSYAHGGCVYMLKQSAAAAFDDVDDEAPAGAAATGEALHATQPAESPAAVDAKEAKAISEPQRPEASSDTSSPAELPPSRRPSGAAGVRCAADLMAQTFEPIQWAVEGLLPRGCWILGGKPKTGKSWLALDLLLAVAGGTEFLGRAVDDGECLYLALEDSDRRMRERIEQLTGGDYPRERLSRLSYHTDWPKGDDCVKQLRVHLRDHPATRLVVVDTLARVKPQAAKGSNAYEADYGALAPLQQLAAQKGVTLVIVTHVRKQQSDDPFDDITGSLGAQAAVDGTIHLSRHKTGTGQLLMLARGRDLDGDLELILSHSKAGFCSLGNPAGVALDGERKRVVEHLEFVGTDGATASEVHKALGRKDLSGTRKLLERLADEFLVLKREGRYFIAGDDEDVDGDVLAAGVLRNSAGPAAAGARA